MKRKKIAVLMASIDREYQQDFAKGLSDAANQLGADICVFNCQGHSNVAISTSDVGESAIFDLPRMRQFDGVISLRETLADEISLRKVEQVLSSFRGRPHVSIDVPTHGAVSILFDDTISVRELTEHMIQEHGARDMVYVCGPRRQLVALNRLNACRETLERHGLELKEEDVYDGEWTRRKGREIALKLLSREKGLPDAVICGNDDMAFGILEQLHEKHIEVPDDLAITGFDALREAVTRGITTICRPIDRAARTALEVLIHWIDFGAPERWDVMMPTIPIYGGTCGCRQHMDHMNEKLRVLGSERRYMEEILNRVSTSSGSLASVGDEADANERIDQFARSWGINEMYLCVDPHIFRDLLPEQRKYAYPDEMLLLYGLRGGERLPVMTFRTEEMVPGFDEDQSSSSCLIFCPLYYRDQNFGYLAIEMGSATGAALYSVLMLLNGALMSLYLQSSLRRNAKKLKDMSVHDIMTGMLNRRGFMERAPMLLEEARSRKKPFAMLSADMDHMKRINDQYGHQAGDEAICRMGKAMERMREIGLIPVHISGDEFLAYGIAEREEKDILATAKRAIQEQNQNDPWIEEISASIGVYAAIPVDGQGIDAFLTCADNAMYAEKNRKKLRKDP